MSVRKQDLAPASGFRILVFCVFLLVALAACTSYPADSLLELRRTTVVDGATERFFVNVTYRDSKATMISQSYVLTQGDFSLMCAEHYDPASGIWVIDAHSPTLLTNRCFDSPMLLTRDEMARAIANRTLTADGCDAGWCYVLSAQGQHY